MLRKYQLQTQSLTDNLKYGSYETLTDSESSNYPSHLEEFANSLGLTPSELNQERFRINRTKMELLIQGSHAVHKDAQEFFQQIMKTTNTFICWPKRLKIGAKNKKDPHVRISGLPVNVLRAKHMITSVLDTPPRVTLKMHVNYKNHSYIIGKGGEKVNQVMKLTHCQIHFPDSNRFSIVEKNCLVSISGETRNVEIARTHIRNLVPLIFEFELPKIHQEYHPFLKEIEKNYEVLVTLRHQPDLNSVLVSVKGNEVDVAKVKVATSLVMALFSGYNTNIMNVQMTMDISSLHYETVMGVNNSNLRAIMANTGTEILISDNRNIDNLKKTIVKIRGNIHAVYLARQQIIGSLPLILIFDLEQSTGPPYHVIDYISTQYNVNIKIKYVAKHDKIVVTMTGIERNAKTIYEAQRQLVELNESNVRANIPATYYTPISNEINSTHLYTNTNQNRTPPAEMGFNNIMLLPFQPNKNPGICVPQINPSSFNNLTPRLFQQERNSSSFPIENGIYNGFPNTYASSCLSDNEYHSLSSVTSKISSPNQSPNRGNSPYVEQSNRDENSSPIETDGHLQVQLEYEQWKLNAYQVMKTKPNNATVRNPSSIWSGRGFSQSTSAYVMKQALNANKQKNNFLKTSQNQNLTDKTNPEMTNFSSLKLSNYLERTPAWIQKSRSNSDNLISLLISLGLESYIGAFISQEIDLETFKLLTEKDLIELGVYSFGPRIKMLTAIKDLSLAEGQRLFDHAPGAEMRRKSLSSTCICLNGNH